MFYVNNYDKGSDPVSYFFTSRLNWESMTLMKSAKGSISSDQGVRMEWMS